MTQVIIPLGGKGTRMKQFGKYYHKSLIPYNEKYLIENILDSIKSLKNLEVLFILNKEKAQNSLILRTIKAYCNKENIHYQILFQQEKYPGPLGAIISVEDKIKEKFLIHLGDVLFKYDEIHEIVGHEKYLGLSYQLVEDSKRWCMINDNFELFDKQNTAPTKKALSGLYYFRDYKKAKQILKQISKENRSKEIQLSELIQKYVELKTDNDSLKLYNYKPLDFGTIEDYLRITFNKTRINHSINIVDNKVIKFSNNISLLNEYAHIKLLKEFNTELYPEVTNFKFIAQDNFSYEIEHIKGKTLEELFLYEDMSLIELKNTLKKIFEYIKNTFKTESNNKMQVLNYLYRRDSIELLPYMDKINLNKVFTHGDLHLANILIGLNNNIKLIDVSGRVNHSKYYDAAKMLHSFYLYNTIKNNLYIVKDRKVIFLIQHVKERFELLKQLFEQNFTKEELLMIKIVTMVMFKTIMPLHEENFRHKQIFYAIHSILKNEVDKNDYSLKLLEEIEL